MPINEGQMYMTIPNLSGVASDEHVSTKKAGSFNADYINWARTLQDIRDNAGDWMPYAETAPDGGIEHHAPDGSVYLMMAWRHASGTTTPPVPHAVMDNRNNAVPKEKVDSRAVSDAWVRGACKSAAATFGYAWQMWSKDDPMSRPEKKTTKKKTGNGKPTTLDMDTIHKIVESFQKWGVEGNDLEVYLGEPRIGWTTEHRKTLGEIYSQLDTGKKTAKEIFA